MIGREHNSKQPSYPSYAAGGQHRSSIGTKTIHAESTEQWQSRINRARELDGVPRLTDDELTIYESHVQHGRTLQAAKLEQAVMQRAFDAGVSPW